MAFFNFPHTRTYDTDLGWLIQEVNRVKELLNQYLENAVITFADPITWNITEQYTALTMVVDSDGTAYLSKQPVPAGIDITNTNYWLPVFNYDDNINTLRAQIAYNAQNSATTGAELQPDDLVFWNGLIYRVLVSMPAGTAFIIGTNIEKYTVDEKFDLIKSDLQQSIADTRTDLEQSIADTRTDLQDSIEDTRTDLQDQIDNISNIINCSYSPLEFGAVGDGLTDDSAAVQETIDKCISDGRILYLSDKTYKVSDLQINNDLMVFNGEFIPIAESAASNQYKNLITGNNSDIKFYNVVFTGLGTALTQTTTKYDYMKFTNSHITFDKCEFYNIHTLNKNTGADPLYNRFGLLMSNFDCDLDFKNNYIHDLTEYEIIWSLALPTSQHYIEFVGNRIENITAWSFDLFSGRVNISDNYIYNYNASTSIFNINGNVINIVHNVLKSIITNTAFDCSENGSLFAHDVTICDNIVETKDKPNWPFQTSFAAVRSYRLICCRNYFRGDSFMNFENSCLQNQDPMIPWEIITEYDADSVIISDNVIKLGTGCTIGNAAIMVWCSAGYGVFTNGILNSLLCEGNHIIYDMEYAKYISGYLYGIPFAVSNQINMTRICNNVVDNIQHSFVSGTQAMFALSRVYHNFTAKLYEIANNAITSNPEITNGVCTLYAFNMNNITAVIYSYVHLDRTTYLGGINPAAYQTGLSASSTSSVQTA